MPVDEKINLEQELSRFTPIDLKALEGKLGTIPDDVRSAISMYNKALDDMRGGNEDMAVIALKKAIALYPGFYEAMNLMGLCHVMLGEDDKARSLFSQIIRMDDSSLRAKNYLDQLDGTLPEQSPVSGGRRTRNRSGKALPAWLARGLSPERNGPWALKYAAGFLAGLLLMGILWQVAGKSPLISIDRSEPASEANQAALLKENKELKALLETKSSDLENANRIQQSYVEEMKDYKVWVTRISELQILLASGKYREVIVKVQKDYEGLEIPEDIRLQIQSVQVEAMPKALRQMYDAAIALYKGNAKARDKAVYQQAMMEFDMALSILETMEAKPTYATELYYTAAKAYWLAGLPNQEEASRQAVDTFNKVIATDPKSARAKSAAVWIAEVQAGRAVKP